jgi:Sister chromatid cohesion protein PDS5 protein
MGFYELSKEERKKKTEDIQRRLFASIKSDSQVKVLPFFSDADTYIRKAAYGSTGKIYNDHEKLQQKILSRLKTSLRQKDYRIRQTTINAAGEIGKSHFEQVQSFFETGLFDKHHSVRNAVIGSIKKMGQKNPKPVLEWSKKYLHHPDKEIRREICHGIELRGRAHPEDILPLLQELQDDSTARVKNTLVHVVGQISYKKGCLAIVIEHLKTWTNKAIVAKAITEIVDVHDRYKDFAELTQRQAREYIQTNL